MNKKHQPFLVQIFILTAITTLVWIGFSVYKALTEEPEPTVTEAVLAHIEPTLDTPILESLGSRLYLNDEEIGDTVLINMEAPEVHEEEPTEESSEEENQEQESAEENQEEKTEAADNLDEQ